MIREQAYRFPMVWSDVESGHDASESSSESSAKSSANDPAKDSSGSYSESFLLRNTSVPVNDLLLSPNLSLQLSDSLRPGSVF